MTESSFSEETRQQATVFDLAASQYEAIFGNNEALQRAVEWLVQRLTPGSEVLDVGSGTGIPTARRLSEAGMIVYGVDISQEMIRLARQNVPTGRFYHMDVTDLRLGDMRFAAITAFFSLLMLRKSAIEQTLQELATRLLPEGYLVISMIEGDFDYIEIPFLGHPVRVSAYPRDQLALLLQQGGLRLIEQEAVDFTPQGDAPPETHLFYFCQRPSVTNP